ncbi:unnamed protein product [Lymnaea stagnalis]|uniref:Uncharacterized protein n=1 Tax=Lymnaea stagnalis TaxID=6523 RepID=A0AAV2HDR6_LYMST
MDNTKKIPDVQKTMEVAEKVELKRELGLIGATSFVIGNVIGSGIFISPKGVLAATGSVALCLLVWLIAGIVSLGSALCYAELGTIIHKSGGTYTYLQKGVGNFLAFVYVLQTVFIQNAGSIIIMLLTFSKYVMSMLPVCGSPVYLEKFITALAILTLILVTSYSTRLASHIVVVTTVGKLVALVIIIAGGTVAMCQGTTSELGSGFSGTSNDPSALALALYSAMWATSGGENITTIVEEVKNPSKNIPRSLIIGLTVVIIIYMLTNLSYLAVLSRAEMLGAPAVAVTFAARTLGPLATLVPFAVMVSTLGASNGSVIGGSRVAFSAGRDGNLPHVLSYIHVHQLTPLSAVLLTAVMAMAMLFPADVESVIDYLGFLGAFMNICVFLAFLRFRLWTMKDVKRPIKVPLVIPILMLLVNVYLFIAPLVISPQLKYVFGAATLLGISVLLYLPFIHLRLKLPYFDTLVTWYQLICQVSPPPDWQD